MSEQTADILRRAKALIDTPEKWYQGNFTSPDGSRMCAIGACRAAAGEIGNLERMTATPEAIRAVRTLMTVIEHNPANWNDAGDRTHAEVMAAFDSAIHLEEQSS